jgi:serine/threonine protein kinase
MFIEGQEILDKRYRVVKKLGGGAFGEIYKGKSSHRFVTRSILYISGEKEDWGVLGRQSCKFFDPT